MVPYIDAHCHIDVYDDIDKVVENAKKVDVNIIVNNGLDVKTNRKTLALSKKFPEIKAALGFYPIDALKVNDEEIDKEIDFIREHKDEIVAIGEVGMDFKYDQENKERQKKIFSKFINLAKELDKPIMVHTRKAEIECIELLEEMKAKKVILHCFTGKKKYIERIKKNKWYMTISTSVVYSEQFQEFVKMMPLDLLFCETDSPFNHPFREEKNEPSTIPEAYKKIAELKGMTLEEVRNNIYMNWQRII